MGKKKLDEHAVAGGLVGVPSLGKVFGLAECPHLAEGEDEGAVDALLPQIKQSVNNDTALKQLLMQLVGDVRGGSKTEAAEPGKFVSSPWRDRQIDPRLEQTIETYANELKRMGFRGSVNSLKPFLMAFAEEVMSAGD